MKKTSLHRGELDIVRCYVPDKQEQTDRERAELRRAWPVYSRQETRARMCKKSCNACSMTHRNAIVQQTPCVDLNSNCNFWYSTGQCTKNPRYILTNCRKSCNNC